MENRDLKKIIFLPGLNGLRTFAAIGVMLGHSTGAIGTLKLNYSLFGWKNGQPDGYSLSEHGVTLFFVLSGFLITFLLLQEEKNTGKVAVKKFYFRRLLRIWPLYYLYLFVCLLLNYFVDGIPFFTTGTLYYLFFAANIPFILNFTLPNVDHYWSIGVEEQFYLFFPWLFWVLTHKRMTSFTVIIIVLAFIRVALWFFMPFTVPAIFSVVNRFDCMLLGAVGAILYFNRNPLFMQFVDNKISQAVALSILFLMLVNQFWFFNSILEIFVVELMTLILIIGQIQIKNRIINLNNTIMDYLGKLSYGIYIIHVLVLHILITYLPWTLVENEILRIALIYIAVSTSTIVLAHLSYNYFEKPFLILKNRFAVIKSSATKTFDTIQK